MTDWLTADTDFAASRLIVFGDQVQDGGFTGTESPTIAVNF